MKTNTHPYALEVEPNPRTGGTWQWGIRMNGKLIQRSDRAQSSEANARAQGAAEIEKLLHGSAERR